MCISMNLESEYNQLIVQCQITQTERFRQALGLKPMSEDERLKLFKIKLWSLEAAQAHANHLLKIKKDSEKLDASS